MQDRGELGRELARVTESMRAQPDGLQRAAALRGIEPARHSQPAAPPPAASEQPKK